MFQFSAKYHEISFIYRDRPRTSNSAHVIKTGPSDLQKYYLQAAALTITLSHHFKGFNEVPTLGLCAQGRDSLLVFFVIEGSGATIFS